MKILPVCTHDTAFNIKETFKINMSMMVANHQIHFLNVLVQCKKCDKWI